MTLLPPYLAAGYDPVLAAQIAKTRPGMAHWAGSGPFGRTCGDCSYLTYWQQIRNTADNIVGTKRRHGCAKFRELTDRHGPVVPKHAEACRYFAPRDENA